MGAPRRKAPNYLSIYLPTYLPTYIPNIHGSCMSNLSCTRPVYLSIPSAPLLVIRFRKSLELEVGERKCDCLPYR